MNVKTYSTSFALCLLMVGACQQKKDEEKLSDAEILYNKTCSLTRLYIDSIKNAKDTLALHQMLDRYEERIDELNMSVKADSDLDLTEGQNDTIMQLLDKLAIARMDRMKELASYSSLSEE